ncbi:voltage-gated potassium channel protein [Pseudoxanthomonas dokdonensis]|uniref:voltage-gated potassium channel protein n=1 Tax=Pseudoxanthomonas dokdonensis TaxID=344882 RepID=UPI000B10D61C|nr:voltage-gated potassium channel protein [Pseudoxanthomonas dokdonensis]
MPHIRKLKNKVLSLFKPAWSLAALVAVSGYFFLSPVLPQLWRMLPEMMQSSHSWGQIFTDLGLLKLPRVIIGSGMMLIAVGLLLRARIAWAFSLLLLASMAFLSLVEPHQTLLPFVSSIPLLLALVYYWRVFDRASLAASTLFAVISLVSLLLYSVFGALFLGQEFSQPITDLSTAFYFSIVSMSTVGYGDITPVSDSARLFTASIIIMGITVFATSASAIIGPMIGGNLKQIITGRISHVMHKNHFIIVGATPLAVSVFRGLKERGETVTCIVPHGVDHRYPAETDVIIGDPTNTETLLQAGANKAKYVMALRDDDAENAFIILAAKEVIGPDTKTVSVVNASQHLQKIKRVQPDMVFSLQLLGSELLVRTLSGEAIDNQLITSLFFGDRQDLETTQAGPETT